MRTIFSSVALSLATICSIVIVPVAEAARRPINRTNDTTKYDPANSATADFMNTRVWIPGKWSIDTDAEGATFTATKNGKVQKVTVKQVELASCQYQTIRQNLLKLWGSTTVTQEQMRIEYVQLGTSKYRGYKWIAPGDDGRTKNWCYPQDSKTAALVTAPATDTTLVKFIDGNLLLQLGIRRSRN